MTDEVKAVSEEKQTNIPEAIRDSTSKLEKIKSFNGIEVDAIGNMMNNHQQLFALEKQYSERKFILDHLKTEIDNIENGKTDFPLIVGIANNVFKTIRKGHETGLLKDMHTNSDMFSNQLKGIDGQILHKYDEFKSSILKAYKTLQTRLISEGFSKEELMPVG